MDSSPRPVLHPVGNVKCTDVLVPRRVCSWATCQKKNNPMFALCDEHVALSKVLGLKVWPA
jgi:hypothetical protein